MSEKVSPEERIQSEIVSHKKCAFENSISLVIKRDTSLSLLEARGYERRLVSIVPREFPHFKDEGCFLCPHNLFQWEGSSSLNAVAFERI